MRRLALCGGVIMEIFEARMFPWVRRSSFSKMKPKKIEKKQTKDETQPANKNINERHKYSTKQ